METVGITKFCIHPEKWFRTKSRIGGTKTLSLAKIAALKPDLIIANKEENVKEQVEALQHIAPVWVSDIHNLDDALGMIRTVGAITFRQQGAERIATQIAFDFEQLYLAGTGLRTLYLIWKNPWMSIGHNTFIHDILQRSGFRNVCDNQNRYPELSSEQIEELDPQLILLSSEPFPFKEQHIAELKALVPGAKIILVDGEMFSWYGSRLLQAAGYLRTISEALFSQGR